MRISIRSLRLSKMGGLLHIATVHFKTPRWIPIQARELSRNIGVPYKTWASLEGIDASYQEYFDRVVDEVGDHACKLNDLATAILREADDDDLLMFLDGDAFPIADLGPLVASGLSVAPLLAVRRAENYDEPQPHPCFCVTRVATWRSLPGDWSAGGAEWMGPLGKPITDLGANLLRRLEQSNTQWRQVLRSNRRNPHPLLFGIYGDVIYHHGAGFRTPSTRVDWELAASRETPGMDRWEVGRTLVERNSRRSDEVFREIEDDEPGWLGQFM